MHQKIETLISSINNVFCLRTHVMCSKDRMVNKRIHAIANVLLFNTARKYSLNQTAMKSELVTLRIHLNYFPKLLPEETLENLYQLKS